MAKQPEVNAIRSVTYYSFPIHWDNVKIKDDFLKELPQIQAKGFNCVWFFLEWKDFEPVAWPEAEVRYNQSSFANLKAIVGALRDRGMCVILPLDYLGVGWSPQGIDPEKWIFEDNSFHAFRLYAVRMAQELKEYENVTYLLFSEGTGPVGAAVNDPKVEQQFLDYLKAVNSEIAYWNGQWKTNFAGWSEVKLANFVGSPPYLEWMDHAARPRLSEVANILKQNGGQGQRVGYHWNFVGSINENRIYSWNGNGPFDFLSFNFYPDTRWSEDPLFYERHMIEIINFLRRIEPNKPVFLGELGMSTYLWTDEAKIEAIINPLLEVVNNRQMGFNIWMWKDLDPRHTSLMDQVTYGIHTLDGREKKMFSLVKPYLENNFRKGDLNRDGRVNETDVQIVKTGFSASYNLYDYNSIVTNWTGS